MSRQEMYAWASLISSIAVVGIYIISVFGWPDSIPDYSERLKWAFIHAFLFAFAVEFILGILDSLDGIEKDERDILYAGKAYRIAYYVLGLGMTAIMFNSLVAGIAESSYQAQFFSNSINIFHSMFIMLFTASIIRRLTQVYYYRVGA